MIRDCLADSILYDVLEKRSPKGLWLRLHTMYMEKYMCNQLMLKRQWFSLWMYEGRDIVRHIQQFDQMSIDLLNLKMKMEEEDKSLIVLIH